MPRSSESSFLIAGFDPSEILQLPPSDLRELLLVDRAILFGAGTAEVLAQLTDRGSTLRIELAQIDGGGEGVLPVLWRVGRSVGSSLGFTSIEWLVYAVHCASPNLKQRRVLERRGFELQTRPVEGDAFVLLDPLETAPGPGP